MNLADTLYREEILEHYQSPLNFGKISDADAYSRQTNPLCGDDIEMWIKFKKFSLGVNRNPPPRWTIKDIKFLGKGCAICLASASILTEYAKGKSKGQLTKLTDLDMLNLLSVEISETRKKCALLSLMVLQDCLRGYAL